MLRALVYEATCARTRPPPSQSATDAPTPASRGGCAGGAPPGTAGGAPPGTAGGGSGWLPAELPAPSTSSSARLSCVPLAEAQREPRRAFGFSAAAAASSASSSSSWPSLSRSHSARAPRRRPRTAPRRRRGGVHLAHLVVAQHAARARSAGGGGCAFDERRRALPPSYPALALGRTGASAAAAAAAPLPVRPRPPPPLLAVALHVRLWRLRAALRRARRRSISSRVPR